MMVYLWSGEGIVWVECTDDTHVRKCIHARTSTHEHLYAPHPTHPPTHADPPLKPVAVQVFHGCGELLGVVEDPREWKLRFDPV